MSYNDRSWAVIDLDAFEHNVRMVKAGLPAGVKLTTVLKANAYSHGDAMLAPVCVRAGADWFATATLPEALRVRAAAGSTPILILGYTEPAQAGVLAKNGITQAAVSKEYAVALAEQAAAQDVAVNVHIKIDTGMSRIGLRADPENLQQLVSDVKEIVALPGLHADGVFSHFSSSDEADGPAVDVTRAQCELFASCCAQLEAAGIALPVKHLANSAGIYNYPESYLSMVRTGSSLFSPSQPGSMHAKLPIKPVMQLYSKIIHVKTVPAGTAVGYNCTFTTTRPTVIATVPLGYGDGYQRRLSNCGEMLVRGTRVPIIGLVCMDQLMLDVTALPDVQPGDIVTAVGRDGQEEITFLELGELVGTHELECMCNIGPRLPRVYIKGGKVVAVTEF